MPAVESRKRSHSVSVDSGHDICSDSGYASLPFTREESPGKNVHFPRNLMLGSTGSDLYRRSLSPMRSAMLKREGTATSPGAHIVTGEDAAEAGRSPKKKAKRGRPQTKVKKSSQRAGKSSEDAIEANLNDLLHSHCITELSEAHEHICNQMNDLRSKVWIFAQSFTNTTHTSDALYSLLKRENQQLVRYIGCLAMSDRRGKEGWRELLSDSTCRQALVLGIVGRALKEKVFDELCFGATVQLIDILSKKEQDHIEQDGFFRTRQRADAILKYENKFLTTSAFDKAVARVAVQLEKMLLPFWKQGSSTAVWRSSNQRQALVTIVESAAHISQAMRKDRDTVYYWPPTFKDEAFEPERMECLDLPFMLRKSPYDRKKTLKGRERAVLRPGHEHEPAAVVRVVCFPGLVSYQQGGGDFAKQELAKENDMDDKAPPDVQENRARKHDQDGLTGDEGFRTRILCKSVVLLQWGEQRLLTKEAGTARHLHAKKSKDKKYEKDGSAFVDLYELFLEETSHSESPHLPEESPSARQSWLPNVSRLFSRSPSVHSELL